MNGLRTVVLATLGAIVGLSIAPAARASDRPAVLNDVARVYSLGVGEVRCPSQEEWTPRHVELRSAGATRTYAGTTAFCRPMICAGATNVGSSSVPAWQQAAGVWMLVHEAFHL